MRHGKAVCFALGILGCLVLIAAATAAESESTATAPRLKVLPNDRVWDLTNERPLGVVVGEMVEHEFVVQNIGTAPLTILEAKPQEAYLTVTVPGEPIAPDQDGTIKAVFNATDLEPSLIETFIVVQSNDPDSERRPVVLTVKAKVAPKPETLFVVRPQEQNVGVMRVGETRTLQYEYENCGTTEFKVYSLTSLDKRFRVVQDIESGVMKAGRKTFAVEFSPLPEDAGREVNTLFMVKTDHTADAPNVICRVKGYVLPEEKKEGVQIIPRFLGTEQAGYVFAFVNNTLQPARVIAKRGDSELGQLLVGPDERRMLPAPNTTEDALSEFSFTVQPASVTTPNEVPPASGTTEVSGEGTSDAPPVPPE